MTAPLHEAPATGLLTRAVQVVGVLAVVSGMAQVIVPGAVLATMGPRFPVTEPARFFFGVIGAFIGLFGGVLLQTVARPWRGVFAVLPWVGCQKLTYAAVVAAGISRGLFAPKAWLVVAFDIAAAVVIFAYFRRRVIPPVSA